jgi:trehalose/maltose hydrolase-like predicted phosphorylase
MSGHIAGAVGILVVDLDEALPADGSSPTSGLGWRLERGSALGLDVVLLAGDGAQGIQERLPVRPIGPGRLVLWVDGGGGVWQAGPDGWRTVGATGAADALAWLGQHIFAARWSEQVLVVGSRARSPGRAHALAAAAAGIAGWSSARRSGGAPGFAPAMDGAVTIDVLDALIADREAFPRPVEDLSWRVEVEGFDPLREREFESWFTVGNGRTGTRGSLEEGSEESAPAVYVAGVYGRREGDLEVPELVVGPDWTRLAPQAAGEPVDLDRGETLEHRRILDLRQGILFRDWRQRLPSGAEVRLRSARFASLADRELLALEAEGRLALEAEGRSALEAEGRSGGRVRLGDGIPLPTGPGPLESADLRAEGGRLLARLAGRDGGVANFAISTREEAGRVERLAAVSRTVRGQPAQGDAEGSLVRAERDGVARVRARHLAAWRERWRDADVVVEGDPQGQRALRFALYHLVAAADPESDLASAGARGLSGPGYRGHVFWDTDVFVVPCFIFTHPPTARALLAYRYRTLPAARDRARRSGYRGALYAWESADTGEEATPASGIDATGTRIPIFTGDQEHHISADVAWAVWRYWQATGDDEFLSGMGAEIVLETARFWASRARRGRDGRYHVGRVIGADEYHVGVDDNAFTNVLARWNLERGLELTELLGGVDAAAWRSLRERLGLGPRELRRWRLVAEGLVDGFDPESLLYEQFAGFHDLEDVVAAELAPRPFPAEVVLSHERMARSRIVKQADVVMLAHMLPEVVRPEVARANYLYYEPRTSHGSSLSPAIHAAVAARLGLDDDAIGYFQIAAGVDLDDRMGNAASGVHVATMGGLWQAAVTGFGGARPDGGVLRLDPRLPRSWDGLAFSLHWRGARLRVDVSSEVLTLALDGQARVAVGSQPPVQLGPGRYQARAGERGWSPPKAADQPARWGS